MDQVQIQTWLASNCRELAADQVVDAVPAKQRMDSARGDGQKTPVQITTAVQARQRTHTQGHDGTRRRLIKRDFDEAFEKCDVIAGPTSPIPSFEFGTKTDNPLEMYLADIYTISTNLATLPGISIPCGLTASGLPAGLQMMARPFNEAALLRAAHCHEQKSGVRLGEPPVA